jgi:hypothetical protein
MQYYKSPQDYSLESNTETFDIFMEKADYIREFSIIGGEPFLYHRHLPDFLEHINSSVYREKIGRMTMFTNGTIVPDGKILELLRDYRIYMFISDYGVLSRKADELSHIFDNYGIPYKRKRELLWFPINRLVDGEAVTDSEVQQRFEKCEPFCSLLSNGKFFGCLFLGAAYNLKAVPDNKENYIDLLNTTVTKEDIRDYISRKDIAKGKAFYPGCRWCSGSDCNATQIEAAVQAREPLPYKRYDGVN